MPRPSTYSQISPTSGQRASSETQEDPGVEEAGPDAEQEVALGLAGAVGDERGDEDAEEAADRLLHGLPAGEPDADQHDAGADRGPDRGLQPGERVGDDEHDHGQAAVDQAAPAADGLHQHRGGLRGRAARAGPPGVAGRRRRRSRAHRLQLVPGVEDHLERRRARISGRGRPAGGPARCRGCGCGRARPGAPTRSRRRALRPRSAPYPAGCRRPTGACRSRSPARPGSRSRPAANRPSARPRAGRRRRAPARPRSGARPPGSTSLGGSARVSRSHCQCKPSGALRSRALCRTETGGRKDDPAWIRWPWCCPVPARRPTSSGGRSCGRCGRRGTGWSRREPVPGPDLVRAAFRALDAAAAEYGSAPSAGRRRLPRRPHRPPAGPPASGLGLDGVVLALPAWTGTPGAVAAATAASAELVDRLGTAGALAAAGTAVGWVAAELAAAWPAYGDGLAASLRAAAAAPGPTRAELAALRRAGRPGRLPGRPAAPGRGRPASGPPRSPGRRPRASCRLRRPGRRPLRPRRRRRWTALHRRPPTPDRRPRSYRRTAIPRPHERARAAATVAGRPCGGSRAPATATSSTPQPRNGDSAASRTAVQRTARPGRDRDVRARAAATVSDGGGGTAGGGRARRPPRWDRGRPAPSSSSGSSTAACAPWTCSACSLMSAGSASGSGSRTGIGDAPRTTTMLRTVSSSTAALAGIGRRRPAEQAAQEPARPVHPDEPHALVTALHRDPPGQLGAEPARAPPARYRPAG